jgi:hypothetical protein
MYFGANRFGVWSECQGLCFDAAWFRYGSQGAGLQVLLSGEAASPSGQVEFLLPAVSCPKWADFWHVHCRHIGFE